MGERKRAVHPGCRNAGNPFHQCGDYCSSSTPSSSSAPAARRGGKPQGAVGNGATGIRVVDPNCVNASNPFHQCAEYCAKRAGDNARKQSGSGRLALPALLKLSPRSPSDRSDGSKSAPNGETVGMDRRNVNPNCANASNPFHQCTENCNKKTADAKKQVAVGQIVANGGLIKEAVLKIEDGRKVDPKCPNASNPFHSCSDYCSRGTTGAKRQTEGRSLGALLARENGQEIAGRENREGEAVVREDKKEEVVVRANKVDPRCPNASNPFHECTEYCLAKINGSSSSERGRRDRGKRSLSLVMGKKDAAVVADRSNRSLSMVVGERDVDPRCVNASNPYHKCAEYCFQKIREAA